MPQTEMLQALVYIWKVLERACYQPKPNLNVVYGKIVFKEIVDNKR
jgi:hypothetical protein